MDKSLEMVKIACNALDEKKADNIKVIDISKISPLADYYIITSGDNINQLHAIVDNVLEKMKKAGYELRSEEGHNSDSWILLDFNDIVIHIFSKEARSYYDIERVWADGKLVSEI